MEQDIGILLNELTSVIGDVSVSYGSMKDKLPRDSSYGINILGISLNLSTKTIFLDDSLRKNLKVSHPSPLIEYNEPLIDILDSPDNLKIVVLLPSVRKEDISFDLKEGFVELVIKKGDQIYRKEIRCKVRPTEIMTKSANYNNSILEIVFKKKINK